LELDVQKSKSKLEVDISQTKFDIAQAKQRLLLSQRAIPYSVQNEIAAYQEVENLEAGLAYAQDVLDTRF
jgi:hypothetical protein